jgi:hypothetical protein
MKRCFGGKSEMRIVAESCGLIECCEENYY